MNSDDNLRPNQHVLVVEMIVDCMKQHCRCKQFNNLKHIKCTRCTDLGDFETEFSSAYKAAELMLRVEMPEMP